MKPELVNLIQRSIAEFNALPCEEQDVILRAQRESWVRAETQPYRNYPDDALLAEWRKWDAHVRDATSWGAALGAASEAREECSKELTRRNISPK